MFILSKRSLKNLEGVHPDLVAVVKRAIEITEQDFMVTEGVRSKEQCCINYGKGRTQAECIAKGVPAKYAQTIDAKGKKVDKVTWLNNPFKSKHADGKAVDVATYPVDWTDRPKFEAIARAMKQAAAELGVDIVWGGDWIKTKDYPHFEV